MPTEIDMMKIAIMRLLMLKGSSVRFEFSSNFLADSFANARIRVANRFRSKIFVYDF